MKNINNYIFEKLRISSKSKFDKYAEFMEEGDEMFIFTITNHKVSDDNYIWEIMISAIVTFKDFKNNTLTYTVHSSFEDGQKHEYDIEAKNVYINNSSYYQKDDFQSKRFLETSIFIGAPEALKLLNFFVKEKIISPKADKIKIIDTLQKKFFDNLDKLNLESTSSLEFKYVEHNYAMYFHTLKQIKNYINNHFPNETNTK